MIVYIQIDLLISRRVFQAMSLIQMQFKQPFLSFSFFFISHIQSTKQMLVLFSKYIQNWTTFHFLLYIGSYHHHLLSKLLLCPLNWSPAPTVASFFLVSTQYLLEESFQNKVRLCYVSALASQNKILNYFHCLQGLPQFGPNYLSDATLLACAPPTTLTFQSSFLASLGIACLLS